MSLSRRHFLAAAALAPVIARAPQATAQNRVLGTVLDYSAGVPSARSVKAAGHLGAVRYVSDPRAGWMRGKPVKLAESRDFQQQGLAVASVYQYGKADTADWLGGAAAAATHAPKAISLHKAAGGPTGRPIYIAIDDNPTRKQYESQIRPYLHAFSLALTAAGYRTGVYGNYNVIQWCTEDGIGSCFWMHDWGSGGRVHPRANIHQVARRVTTIDGVDCDVNDVYTQDWGQWEVSAPAPSDPIKDASQLSSELSSMIPWDKLLK